MTDTITIELPREVAEAIVEPVTAKSLEFEFFGAESLVVAVQEALANPTRSDESELRGSVTIEEKEDGDWLCFSPPEGSFVMVLLDGIGGPIIQRSIRATAAALSKTVEDPPPTAPGEASQEVSEGVDCSRGGDGPYWVRAEPVPTAQRFEFTIVGPDGVAEAGSFIGDHESRDLAEEEAESLNAAYAEGYGAAQNEARVATNPSPSAPLGEGFRSVAIKLGAIVARDIDQPGAKDALTELQQALYPDETGGVELMDSAANQTDPEGEGE